MRGFLPAELPPVGLCGVERLARFVCLVALQVRDFVVVVVHDAPSLLMK